MSTPSIWDILNNIDAGVPAALGQTTSANSTPVVIASDQSAIPVSGTISIGSGPFAVTQSGTWNINNVSGTVSLPTGAATASLQTQPGVDIGDVTINNAAGASAVNIQDGGNSITVDGSVSAVQSGTWNITNVSGTVSLPTGAATSANQATEIASLASIDAGIPAALGQTTMASSMPVVIASNQSTLAISAASLPLPTGAATLAGQTQPGVDIGDVTINNASGGGAVNIQDGGNSITVDGTITTSPTAATTATLSNVAGSATSVTLLASNANRKKAVIVNDSTASLYVKFGSTASVTSYTYYLGPSTSLPGDTLIEDGVSVYTGIITGIWSSAAGNARVTEITP